MANNVTLSYPSAFYHQFFDRNGKPLTGGKLYTYSAGTNTPIPTYKTIGDTSSTNTNTNPIILDNAGMAYIVIETDRAYKFVLFDKNDAKIDEWDNVTGNIGGGGGGSEDIVVVGTPNEIDVSDSVTQGVKRYVISLSNSIKSTILYLVGLYNNVINLLGNKADKVQGATAGNLAALDASGNLEDSGSKVADFKPKQTPVTDPSASGAGLEFIDSVTQDANGVITPHKKSVQDGTTAQKGVLQLQDSIGSTESTTDKAVTPHAVREAINSAVSSAYHAAGTKTIAQLTSSLLVAENEGCVYNVTDSGTTTSDFVDGSGHPINAGDNVGVCDVGGGVYKFDLLSGFVDLSNYLTKTGDASNTTATFAKASGDTSTIANGSKLSAIFTAISSFFASVVSAIGGKADKVSGATNGNFAGLDSNGNLTDSGKKAADFEPAFSVLSINKGGTGKTTGKAATNNLFSDINSVNIDPDDTARIVFKYGSPSDSNGIFFTIAITNLWNYIKGKISSVLGLSESGYTGNAATATTAAGYTNDGAIATALTGKLAKADASISVDGLSGNRWYKVAETSFTSSYGNKSATFEVNYTDSDWKITTLLIDFNIRSQNANKPYEVSINAVATKVLTECDVRIVSRGAISSRKVEIWVKCGASETRSSAFVSEHASGGYLYNTTSTFTYTSYSATAGQVEPTTDEPNNVYVYAPTIKSIPSVINNLTSDSTTDALSAAQGKVLNTNQKNYVGGVMIDKNAQTLKRWAKIAYATYGATELTGLELSLSVSPSGYQNGNSLIGILAIGFTIGNGSVTSHTQTAYWFKYSLNFDCEVLVNTSTRTIELWAMSGTTDVSAYLHQLSNFKFTMNYGNDRSQQLTDADYATYKSNGFTTYTFTKYTLTRSEGGKGSTSVPVYVDSNGQVQPCNVLSGGTSNFNRTFTTTFTVGSTDQYITMLIKNDNNDLIADYVAWHNANYGKLSSPPMIIISVFTRDTDVSNPGLISLNMYKTGNGCDVFGEKYAYMGNQHGSRAYNTQYFTDQTFVSGSAYYLNIRNETANTMWTAGTILDISIRIVAHAVSVT